MAIGWVGAAVKILTASGRVGFAALVCGGLVWAGKSYGIPPLNRILDDQLLWVVIAAIFGGCLVVADLLFWIGKRLPTAWHSADSTLKHAWRLRSAPHRIDVLTSSELSAVAWLLLHERETVEANYLSDPFFRLVRRGFLTTTDGRAQHQVLRVNPRLKAKSTQIVQRAVAARGKLGDAASPPWIKPSPWV